MPTATSARSRARATPDALCAAAVDLARLAAEEVAPGLVGDAVEMVADGERVVTHLFTCTDRAYRGWSWAVTVARASRSKIVTVDEVVLLPGGDALLAPPWVPWHERVRPGDLGVGDLMVTPVDDDRLVPAYSAADDPSEEAVAFEFGLGRVRVLSLEGRDDAAERWYDGVPGPAAPIAVAAPARCVECGFFVPLHGGLGQLFGACANEYAPDDGRVVSADHGCGAHSEAVVSSVRPEAAQARVDDYLYEHSDVSAEPAPVAADPAGEDDAPAVRATGPAAVHGSVDGDEAEPLGHS